MPTSEVNHADSKADELEDHGSSVIPGVPDAIALPFLRGLDEAKQGRVVDGDAVIAESRALLSRYRQNKQKNGSTFPDRS
jgi:hypothetical protein